MGVMGGSGGKGRGERGGGGESGGGAEGGSESEHTGGPVDAGVVADQPREAQNEFKMTQLHHMGGKNLRMHPMNPEGGCKVVGDGSCRWWAAI